jgi:hypothetical protein
MVILRFRPEKAEFWHRFWTVETQLMRSDCSTGMTVTVTDTMTAN